MTMTKEEHRRRQRIYKQRYRERHRDEIKARRLIRNRVKKEEINAAARRWRAANIEHVRQRTKLYYRKKRREASRAKNLKQFGLTLQQYDALVALQNGVCAICLKAETHVHKRSADPEMQEVRRLAVDHDHVSGRVRGLLCTGCNAALGNFRDDQWAMARAIEYLTRTAAP